MTCDQEQFFFVCISLAVTNHSFFTELAFWADSVYKSRCPSVCVCVCVSVCMSPLVRYRLNVFLPPFTKVLGQFFLDFCIP